MAFAVGKLTHFGLIDDAASPATRVYSGDIHSEASASIRQVPDTDTDPDGATFFTGFRSEVGLQSADVDDFSQADTYMSGRTGVKMVAVHEDLLVQWYNRSRIQAREALTPEEAALVRDEHVMVKDGGDLTSHDVYLTRNGLLHLAPQSGGWADTDSNNTPDGYTETNLTGSTFSGGTYSANVDTAGGSDGSLNVTIPFPLDGVDVTLSVQVNTLHDDGSNAIRIEALDSDGSTVQDFADVSFTSTGRKHVDFTTPTEDGSGATYYLKCYPIRVTGATAETTAFDIQDPCLRVDGETTYVKK